MPIKITITNQIVGNGVICAQKGKPETATPVPLYKMVIENNENVVAELPVTRDTSKNEQCPPNKPGVPYQARIRTDGERGFRLELYEEALCKDRSPNLLQGTGKTSRTSIQIHIGPAYSEGCICLTDGEKGRDSLEKIIRTLQESKHGNEYFEICVEEY